MVLAEKEEEEQVDVVPLLLPRVLFLEAGEVAVALGGGGVVDSSPEAAAHCHSTAHILASWRQKPSILTTWLTSHSHETMAQ